MFYTKTFLKLFTAFSLVACTTANSESIDRDLAAGKLNIKSHAANAAGFHVTSHLIYGPTESVLVDAQFTRSEARKVVELIKSTNTTLKTVFVTHGHPDHYFGIEVLRKEFPDAKYVASAETIADIKAHAQAHHAQWKPLYKDDLTDKVPEVAELEGDLSVDGQVLEVLSLGEGESEHANAVLIPQLQTVLTGDALSDGVHFWLAEGHIGGVKDNFTALKQVQGVRYLPGHAVAVKASGVELIERNEAYVKAFEDAVRVSKTAEELAARIKALYPSYALPIIADIAAKAVMTQK